MTDLERLCEEALYEKIQDLGDGKTIVRDVATGRLLYRKVLKVYNPQVFTYLRDHRSRYVPRIESIREEEDALVVIEEYIQGRTLENVLEEAEAETAGQTDPVKDGSAGPGQDNPLPFQERIRILTEICDGLTFLHSAQPPIIHRDLKASNIMLTEDGVVKIIDYDAAKIYVSGEKKDTVLMGTHGVAAPEQYGFAPSDVRTDIYGLGKLVERMLPDNVDADRVVARATHMDPKKRYASAAQMRDQIVRIRERASSFDTRLEKIVPAYDPRSKGHRAAARVMIVALCAAILSAAGLAYWRIRVYPAQQRAAMQAELSAIGSGQATAYEIPNLLEQYLDKYPYEEMAEEDRKEFRDAVENLLQRYVEPNYTVTKINAVLSEKCGGEEFTEMISRYVEAERAVKSSQFEEALGILKELKTAGAVDADEKWTDALEQCREKADYKERSFEKNGSFEDAKSGLDLYRVYTSCTDQGTDPVSNGSDAWSSFNRLFQSVLDRADGESRSGKYEFASKYYAMLEDFRLTPETEKIDLEEKQKENKYRNGAQLLEEKKYDQAYELFAELEDYQDSAEKALQCQYLKAEACRKEEDYKTAVTAYELCRKYKDAEDKLLETKYLHCRSVQEKPDDEAYEYIGELLAYKYPGAEEVRDTMYQWHVEIRNGLEILLGSQQSSHIRVDLYGGPPDASTRIRIETTDNVSGDRISWTSPEACSRGGHVDASYNANTYEYSIFEREHTLRVYDDTGTMIGTWTGVFTKEFMEDEDDETVPF